MGRIGNGVGYVVTLGESGKDMVDRFWTQIRSPQLDSVRIDFGSALARGLTPENFPRIYAGTPITIFGQYLNPSAATIALTGTKGGSPYLQSLQVDFPEIDPINRTLPKMWAREKIKRWELDGSKKDSVTRYGLAYSVMTEYTSLVAVSDKVVNTGKTWTTVEISALYPDGVDPFMAGGDIIVGDPNQGDAPPTGVITEVESKPASVASPASFTLNAEPNPFNPRVSLALTLPSEFSDIVLIEIYGINGSIVKRLFRGVIGSNRFTVEWNGTDDTGARLSSGIYMVRATCGKTVLNQRIILAK
jgi:hypothetical protein